MTTSENSDRYISHLRRSVIPELEPMRGFMGIYVLRRESEAGYDFRILTLWESMDVIRQFAGGDIDRAVVPPDAQAVLDRFDDTVMHYEVVEYATRDG